MLLIRDRSEFKARLLEQEAMIRGQLVTAKGQKAIARITGTLHGIAIARTALEAWEEFDMGLVADASQEPPDSPATASKQTVLRPFNCNNFGPGTAGFHGYCSHCERRAAWMARIFGKYGRSRAVSLCQYHAERTKNAVFEDAASR